jgi:hypothetical protein
MEAQKKKITEISVGDSCRNYRTQMKELTIFSKEEPVNLPQRSLQKINARKILKITQTFLFCQNHRTNHKNYLEPLNA